MFGLFKSPELKEKERLVDEMGRDIFRQIALFRDLVRVGVISDEITNQRINAAFTAGYILNFIQKSLFEIFDEEKMRQKYLEKVCFNVLGKNGYTLIKTKSAACELCDEMPHSNEKFNQKMNTFVHEYETGFSAAKTEFEKWTNDKTYEPHMLFDYLKTGNLH